MPRSLSGKPLAVYPGTFGSACVTASRLARAEPSALLTVYQDHVDKMDQWVWDQLKHGGSKTVGTKNLFPMTLHAMLDHVSASSDSVAIGWLAHGRAFKVWDKERFVKDVLPKFFDGQSMYASFQRQLNMYGFAQITSRDKGAYYHEYCLRGRPLLCRLIARRQENTHTVRRSYDTSTEPDFDRLPPLPWMIVQEAATRPPDAPQHNMGHTRDMAFAEVSTSNNVPNNANVVVPPVVLTAQSDRALSHWNCETMAAWSAPIALHLAPSNVETNQSTPYVPRNQTELLGQSLTLASTQTSPMHRNESQSDPCFSRLWIPPVEEASHVHSLQPTTEDLDTKPASRDPMPSSQSSTSHGPVQLLDTSAPIAVAPPWSSQQPPRSSAAPSPMNSVAADDWISTPSSSLADQDGTTAAVQRKDDDQSMQSLDLSHDCASPMEDGDETST